MEQHLEIGDTVLILEPTDEQKKNYNCTWVPYMSEYINQKATIVRRADGKNCYKIDIDHCEYWWDPVHFKKDITNNQLLWL